MKTNTAQKITIAYSGILCIFWVVLRVSGLRMGTANYLFSLSTSILPLVAGAIIFYCSIVSKETKGFIGRGIFFMGTGLLFWGIAGSIWSYFNFFMDVSLPYPSVADIGYVISEFAYCIGIVYLARASGADFGLRRRFAKPFIVLVSVGMLVLSYYLLVDVARDGVLFFSADPILKIVLDIAYPLGDFIGLTLAVVISGLSFKFIMKEYRFAVIALLIGLVAVYVADMVFSYTTTLGTFYNGDVSDLLFTVGLGLFTFGALGFCGAKQEGVVDGVPVTKIFWYP